MVGLIVLAAVVSVCPGIPTWAAALIQIKDSDDGIDVRSWPVTLIREREKFA
jgi:hypothetical protein